MRILILEDEPLIAKSLSILIKKLLPDASIINIITSVRETIEFMNSGAEPDLIFADIQLSDGISFQALEHINKGIPIIFTTAFDEYSLRAFKLNSIDYLLKPIDEQELKQALDKLHFLKQKAEQPNFYDVLKELVNKNEMPSKFKHRFLAYSGKSIVPVSINDVCCFEKEEIIFVRTRDGKQYVTEYRSLDEIQEMVDPTVFFRANRQTLIHADFIQKFEVDFMGKINIQLNTPDKKIIQVSKDKASAFRNWVEERK